jgi:Caenorhabditis protein of unknown function, DUF268
MSLTAAKRSRVLSAIYWWMLQLGFDPRATVRAIVELPLYLKNLRHFRKSFRGTLHLRPSLHDRRETAGAVGSEYFWQDLCVAQKIFTAKPARHVDVGSRIDGFVAHLASFRALEVLDVRPMRVKIPNVSFMQADMMRPAAGLLGMTPSLSCLHALEHFGLGRYGDPINVDGHLEGLRGLASLLARDGILYLGCPTGKYRVDFDSHRVLDPVQIVEFARGVGLLVESLVTCTSEGLFEETGISSDRLRELARRKYSLCVYIFRKVV